MIDRHASLATLKPLVTELEDSIRARAVETPDVAEHLEREHHRAVVAGRTAMSLGEWRDGEITQAAVAWVLGCVFVRFLEDNGLIDQALISGPGGRRAAALGHREEHFRAHPSHSDREYLEACFREVANYRAAAPLYDERHNPLWRLFPTADGARLLRETFTAIDPDTGALVHDFADAELDTRFLGDLYQDLSDAARKRYALLRPPSSSSVSSWTGPSIPRSRSSASRTSGSSTPHAGQGIFSSAPSSDSSPSGKPAKRQQLQRC